MPGLTIGRGSGQGWGGIGVKIGCETEVGGGRN